MPLVSYIHGGKGFARLRFTANPYDATPNYKLVPIAPMRAAISWDEPLIPTELFEGLREVYAWMGGPRLCTWSVQGYLLGHDATLASITDVLNSVFSVTQASSSGFYVRLNGAFALDVFDGSWLASIPPISGGVQFPGVAVSVMLDYPPGAPIAIRIDGISGVPADDTYLQAGQNPTPPLVTSISKPFINAGKTTVNLDTTTIHALNLTIAANREPQVLYTLSPSLVIPDPRFTGASGTDPFIGNQHFLYPLVTSVGRIRATASFVVDNKILTRRNIPDSGSSDTILNSSSYDAKDLTATVPYTSTQNLRINMKRVALRGKSNVFTSSPRVPTVIVAIANPRSTADTASDETVITAQLINA